MKLSKEPETPRRALIYCRVSSKKQSAEGSGLDSQEHRCREYAAERGYLVDAIFPDDVSGGGDFMKRPGMVALLAYLDAKPFENYVVIFDDLKRYARDTEFHLKLKREMAARGAERECLNFKFENTPEGKFIETVFAAHGELEREQNGRQVRQKMKARMQQGFWVFPKPVGYRYAPSKKGGKILVRDEPVASIVAEALEGYAAGRLETLTEVKRFLESRPEFPKSPNGQVTVQFVSELLTRPLYAGYYSHEAWGISWRQAQHEPLISLATYNKIQERRENGAKAPARKDLNEDFPLRGFVLCNDCHEPLTSCWSAGKRKKYPYYFCDTKGCDAYRKSIRRSDIEEKFDSVMRRLAPSSKLIDLAIAMFKDAWEQRGRQTEEVSAGLKRELALVEKQIESLVQRVMDATCATVISAYEAKIERLERQRAEFKERQQHLQPPKGSFEKLIEHSLVFLTNPHKLWASGDLAAKRTVLRLAFVERLAYCRKTGYRTPKTSFPFKVLGQIHRGEYDMVEPRGIEPLTSTMPL